MIKQLTCVLMAMLMLTAAFVLLDISSDVAKADVHYVSPTGSTFATIQAAIDAAIDDDTIIVGPGTYAEDLTITKDLYILGNDTYRCNLTGAGGVAVTVDANPYLVSLENLNISTTAADTDALACINYGWVEVTNCRLNVTGSGSFPVHADGSYVDLYDCEVDYYEEVIEAIEGTSDIGYVSTYDMMINGTHVNLDANSVVDVYFTTEVQFFYIDGFTPVQNAEVNITVMDDNDHWANYRTMMYGGMEPTTDLNGAVYTYMMSAYYEGATTTWAYQDVIVYKNETYKGGLIEYNNTWHVTDINDTQTVMLIFDEDIRAPPAVVNVTADTLDYMSINVSWEANTNPDHLNYSVYQTEFDGSNAVLLGNTTMEYYVDTGLDAATAYYYVITAWDTAMFESMPSSVANNVTDNPPWGMVSGTVTFADETTSRGVEAQNRSAIVELLNETGVVLQSAPVNFTEYNYTFTNIAFQDNLTIRAIPNATIAGAMNVCSGWMTNTTDLFNLTMANWDLTFDLVLEYIYCDPFSTIDGMITYKGGPMDGQVVYNATVFLLNETGAVAGSTNTSMTGAYTLVDMPNHRTYTLSVEPPAEYISSETSSGYDINDTNVWELTDDITVDIELEYFQYVAPPALNITAKEPVGVNATIDGDFVLTFNFEMNTSAAEAAFSITPTVADLNFSWDATNTTVTISHADLAYDTMYEITIDPLLASLDGYAFPVGFTDNVWNFTTVAETITYYLEVVTMTPVGTSVALDTTMDFVFNYEVDTTAFEAAFTITPAVTGLTYTWDAGNMTMIVGHDDFAGDTDYNVTLAGSLKSVEGWAFMNTSTKSYPFHTAVGTTPPAKTISISEPTSGAEFKPGETITVSGTTANVADGELVTVTVEGETPVTTTVTGDAWSVDVTLPDDADTYTVTAGVPGATDAVITVTVKEESSGDDNMLLFIGIAAVVVVLLLVIVVVVFFLMKKPSEPEEDLDEDDEDEDEEEYDEEDEDEEDEDEEEYDEEDEDEEEEDDDEYEDEDEEEVDDEDLEDDEDLDDDDDLEDEEEE